MKRAAHRYAARGDAYIFAYYRDLLSKKYEAELKLRKLRIGLFSLIEKSPARKAEAVNATSTLPEMPF